MNPTEPRTLADPVPDAALGGPSTESPEVTALVERAKGGDADAFADLMRLYERRVIALGMQMGLPREDAMDACQEAFVKVFRYLGSFRSGRSFFKWLYRIALNVIYDALRERRARAQVPIDDLPEAPAEAGEGLHRRLEAAQLAGRVRECLEHLSRREREVFVLRDLQDLGTDEIGAILGLSQITVRRHCMLARRKVRERVFGPRD
jgi:RNA polymerase sigma-70 factor (ECF subfamily)